MALQDRGVPTLVIIPLFQIFAGLLLFFALLKGLRDLTILTILILSFVGAAWLWTRGSLRKLACHFLMDREKLFPGETVTFAVRADNRKILPLWLQIVVPFKSLIASHEEAANFVKEGGLLWYQRAHFGWEWTAKQRGVYRIGPPRILAGDLFAFFTRRQRSDREFTLLVYPRLLPVKSFSLPRRDFFGIPGARRPVQDPVYILGTRDYRYGRPAKYIHWKASARRTCLQEKVLESTHQEKVLLIVDVIQFYRAKAGEEFEKALSMAASVAAMLDRRGHSLGLVTNGFIEGNESPLVPIARNNEQLPAILEFLARLKLKPRFRITDVVRLGINGSRDLTCVCFFYRADRTLGLVHEYLKGANIPAVSFVNRPVVPSPEDRSVRTDAIYGLECLNNEGAARL